MKLPIIAFGNPILKKISKYIDLNYNELDQLCENMWETMYNAKGVGLAAPQIGLNIRVFIIDTLQYQNEEEPDFKGLKKVIINAVMLEEFGEKMSYEEGCLSIPNIRAEVSRHSNIRIRYTDENWTTHEEEFTGINARVIQHEYDHIEGILFTDRINSVKKRILHNKLENIRKGKIATEYAMKFA